MLKSIHRQQDDHKAVLGREEHIDVLVVAAMKPSEGENSTVPTSGRPQPYRAEIIDSTRNMLSKHFHTSDSFAVYS